MERKEAARVLVEVARMRELSSAKRFKARAYENAAGALLAFPGDLDEAVRTGMLRELPGIGEPIFANVRTLATTGRLPLYDELRASWPPGLSDCLRVPGLGARKLRHLYQALGIDSLDALEQACRDRRLASLRGFGPKSAERYGRVRRASFPSREARRRSRPTSCSIESPARGSSPQPYRAGNACGMTTFEGVERWPSSPATPPPTSPFRPPSATRSPCPITGARRA
jgi:DNA polymerase/3'-5' exonuclease PolX